MEDPTEAVKRLSEAAKRVAASHGTTLASQLGSMPKLPGGDDLVDLVGDLAAVCWDEDAELLDLVGDDAALQHDRRPVRRVAAYYHGLGTGGAERVTLDLAALWRSMGLEVLLICDAGRSADAVLPEGVDLAEIPDAWNAAREGYAARGAALANVLKTFGADCLVFGAWLSSTIAWDLLVTKAMGVSFVVFCHGSHRALTGWNDPRALRVTSIYRHVDAVMCLSRDDQEFWSCFNPHAFRTINGVGEQFLHGEPARLDGHKLVWVGRIASDKTPLEALDVLQEVRSQVPDATLVFLGPFGDYDRAWFEEQARAKGVLEAIVFKGGVPHDELPSAMREADALLHTSHFEGYPIAVGEARACGLPCVMYDLDYLTLLEGHRGALCAPVGDVSALAAQAVAILCDDDLRHRLGNEAFVHANELATFDFAGLWREVFDCVEKGGKSQEASQRGHLVSSTLRQADLMVEEARASRDDHYGALEEARAERDALRRELEEERLKAADLEEQLDGVTGSVSFSIGRAVTAPLRMGRSIVMGGKRTQ